MKKIRTSMKFAALSLVALLVVLSGIIPVNAAIVIPGHTESVTIDTTNFTRDTYLNELKAKGIANIVPVVWEPIVDGVDLRPHPELGNQELAKIGVIDVTAAPFQADPTGVTDSTERLQKAIDYGRTNQMVVFFPSGTYLISNTLLIQTGISLRSNLTFVCNKNEMPTVLVGSTKGNGVKIKLADNAPGFDNPDKAKAILHYHQPRIDSSGKKFTIKWGEHASNIEGNIMIDHLNIETGKNPGAIGIHMASAEGAVLQDVNINATGALCGIIGGSGNGGAWTNITVTGGKIGIDTRINTITLPGMENVTIQGQTHVGWLSGGKGSNVIAGMKIIADYEGPAIIMKSQAQAYFGSLNLIDSEIQYNKAYAGAAIAGTTSAITLESNSPNCDEIPEVTDIPKGLYLNNVYVKNAKTVVRNALEGNPDGWMQVKEFAYGKDETVANYKAENIQFYNTVYKDKTKVGNTYSETALNVIPPKDLESRHGWLPDQIPTFETAGAVNVKNAPYNAKGDGIADDTAALQKAIDENEIIFLPKGYYRISDTLKLKPNTKIFGVSPAHSTIFNQVEDVKTGKPFGDPKNPKPLVETADAADANTIISNIGISPSKEVPSDPKLFPADGKMPVYTLKWQSGGKSLIRSVLLEPIRTYGFLGSEQAAKYNMRSPVWENPLVVISGNGGGRIYNAYLQMFLTKVTEDMRLLAIRGAKSPLALYNSEWQYLESTPVEITNSQYVTFYGSKTEGNFTYLDIKDSDHIRIFGHSGNGNGPYDNGSIAMPATIEDAKKGHFFKVQNVPNLLITNLNDQVNYTRETFKTGLNEIRTYYALYWPLTVDGVSVPSNERPVMYKIGNPVGASPAALDVKPAVSNGDNNRKIIIGASSLLGLIALALAAWWMQKKFKRSKSQV